jgi:hypothetical protein
VLIAFLIVYVPYFLDIPPLAYAAGKLTTISAIIGAFAVILGVIGQVKRAYSVVNQRIRGYYFYVYMLLMLFITVAFGGVLGTDSAQYQWLQEAFIKTLGTTNYTLLVFYMASSGARAMRARSSKAAALLIAGLIVFLGQAPLTQAIFPPIGTVHLFLSDTLSLSIGRMFLLSVTVGAIVMGVRILTGKEVTFLGFLEEGGGG